MSQPLKIGDRVHFIAHVGIEGINNNPDTVVALYGGGVTVSFNKPCQGHILAGHPNSWNCGRNQLEIITYASPLEQSVADYVRDEMAALRSQ